MSTEWEPRVKALFFAALRLPPGQREHFLQQECGGDAGLQARLQTLLEETGSEVKTVAQPPNSVATRDDFTPAAATLNGLAAETLPRTFGGFELLERLGQGGMGVVYKARQLSVNRIVALKLLRPDLLETDQTPAQRQHLLMRFQRETEAAGRLNHPHLLTVFEVGCHEGRNYFTMRYVEGRSLDKVLRAGLLPQRQAAQLMETVARAVHAANTAGVLHRDLKPANILLDQQEQPFVADFGLAKFLTENRELTLTAIVGTAGYMAPEQARGDPVTTASDQFSLGVILYQMLTGQKPFPGPSFHEALRQVCDLDPTPPRRVQPMLPRDLETICLKCLHKEPKHRYQSCAELADDLACWLRSEPIKARPINSLERFQLWSKRKPWLATLSACLVLAVLVGAVAVLWQWREAEGQRRIANETVKVVLNRINKNNDEIANSRWLDAPGTRPLRLQMLAEARAFCAELQQHRQDDPAIRAEIARAWGLLGSLTQDAEPGEKALEPLHHAENIYAALLEEHPNDPEYRRGLALAQVNLGRAYRYSSETDKSRSNHVKAVDLYQQLIRERGEAAPADLRFEYALALHASTWLLEDEKEKTRRTQESLRLGEQAVAEQPGRVNWIAYLAHKYSALGIDQAQAEKFDDGWQTYEKYAALLTTVPPEDQNRVRVQQITGMYENGIVVLCVREHRSRKDDPEPLTRAQPHLKKALEIRQKLVSDNPETSEFLAELAVTELNAGVCAAFLDRSLDAVVSFRSSVDHFKQWKAKNKNNPLQQGIIASGCFYLGREYVKLGKYEEAFAALIESFDTPNEPTQKRWRELADELNRCAAHLRNPADRDRCGALRRQCLQAADAMAAARKP